MIRFRISTLFWVTSLACTFLFFAVRETKQNRRIQDLTEQIELLEQQKMLRPNYADMDVYIPESPDGSINISGSRVFP